MQPLEHALNWNVTAEGLVLRFPAATVTLTPLADDLVRLRVAAEGAQAPETGAVIGALSPLAPQVTEREGGLVFRAGRVRVDVRLAPLQLTWYEGERLFARDEALLVAPDRVVLRRSMPPGEHYYGFGEKTGFLDKRGRRMEMWATDNTLHTPTADPMYQSIPFFLALRDGRAHGLFVDSGARSIFDMGSLDPTDFYTVEVHSPVLDAYVFAGPRMADIIGRYTELTGRMELPPLWTLGFHQCRWSYFPEAKVRDIARNFRERDIPCDAIWLDIDYMDGYRVFTWDRERFPDPEGLIADLGRDGFRVVTIVDPGVKQDEHFQVYREGVEKGYFITQPDGALTVGEVWPGAAVFPDFQREAVRRWWGDLYRGAYYEKGVAGVWNDMNEPVNWVANAAGEKTLPHDALQGEPGSQVPHAAVHNLYGFNMARATYEGWKRHRPERRPFILTRSGYAGIQRYAAVWMGDNHSWWEHIVAHMTMCAGMGLSGVPFVGTDIGGFSENPSGELVARWIALGAVTPFFRMHTAWGTRDQEPWSFGPEVEAICRKYIRLRYRLLPYLYTLMEEAARTGLPVMRPLVLEYQDDPETYPISDQVLIGRDLLAAPVYQPGVTRRLVYLPAGAWYDFWTGERYEGGQYIVARAPLDVLPLYVRAGAVLPMAPVMRYTGEAPVETLTLHVYAGEGEFTLYEDEGEGYGYRRGVCARTRVTVRPDEVTVGRPEGGYTPTWRRVEVVLHGFDGDLVVDGTPVAGGAAEAAAGADVIGGAGRRLVVERQGGFTVTVRPR